MTQNQHPEKYWHCLLRLKGSDKRDYSVINDLSYTELNSQIVNPWLQSKPFAVAGRLIKDINDIDTIRIVHTRESKRYYQTAHDHRKRAQGFSDTATDRRLLPIWEGTDYTNELILSEVPKEKTDSDLSLVLRLCQRIRHVARILANRQRNEKGPFLIEDEYDVQDLLHAMLRGYLEYSVQEDPLGKVAGAKSSRADISIEDLGVLIEAKYARKPSDHKKIFEEISQDLTLYAKCDYLETLIVIIYNSDSLRDPESLQKLSGNKEINNKRFDVRIILA